MYHEILKSHTLKDEEIDWKRLKSIQDDVRAHGRALIRIFKVGTKGGKQNTGSAHVTGKLDHHFAKYDSVQEL